MSAMLTPLYPIDDRPLGTDRRPNPPHSNRGEGPSHSFVRERRSQIRLVQVLAHEQLGNRTVLIVLRPDVRAAPVNSDDLLVPDDPSIVPGLEHAHLSWTDLELGAVSHTHTDPSRN